MYLFLNGFTSMGCLVAALFFLDLRRRTGDAFFAFFAGAFLLLGVERVVLGFLNVPEQSTPAVYVLRALAFSLIILGIVWKNLHRSTE
jgi:hypothetical protein